MDKLYRYYIKYLSIDKFENKLNIYKKYLEYKRKKYNKYKNKINEPQIIKYKENKEYRKKIGIHKKLS